MSKIVDFLKSTGKLFKETFQEYGKREPFRNSAVIAYFAIFSLPGLLIIVINIAGYVMERESIQNSVSHEVADVIGQQAAKDINGIIKNVQADKNTTLATVLSGAILIFGATGIFYHLQKSLNIMWGVEAQPKQKWLKLLKDRLFSFGMIVVIGLLLIISFVISALLTAASDWVGQYFFNDILVLFQLLELLFSLVVITFLFAALFKFLPNADIPWRSVWIGAFLTTILFLLAQYALSIYFGEADPGAVYGAASSIILVMLWVTYVAMIVLFGAQFAITYAKAKGYSIKPS